MRSSIILYIVVLSLSISSAGWAHLYGTDKTDEGNFITQLSDSGYIVVGFTRHQNPYQPDPYDSTEDIYVIRLDQNGDTIWTRQYGTAEAEAGYSAVVTDSSVIIQGMYSSFPPANFTGHIYMLEIDMDGNLLRQIFFTPEDSEIYERSYSITKYGDDQFILAGISFHFPYVEETKAWFLKINSDGDTLNYFSITYPDSTTGLMGYDIEVPHGNVLLSRSGLIILPWAIADSAGDAYDIVPTGGILIAIDTSFTDTVWTVELHGALRYSRLYDIIQTNYDTIFATVGVTEDLFWVDGLLGLVTSTGRVIVSRTITGYAPRKILSLSDDRFAIFCDGERGYIYVLITDFTGTVLEEIPIHIEGLDSTSGWIFPYYAIRTYDGGFAITGAAAVDSFIATNVDVFVIKTDSLFNVSWVKQIPVRPQDMKISAYPNPFNSACEIVAPAGSKVKIYNTSGKLVWEATAPSGAGNTKITWNPEGSIPSGVYLIEAQKEDAAARCRVVLVK